MIQFSVFEIFRACTLALIWGVLFAIFYSICKCIYILPENIVKICKNMPFRFCETHLGGVGILLYSLVFSFGILLTSYIALDGIIRAYMIALSLACFFVCKSSILKLTFLLSYYLCKLLLYPFVNFFRKKHL